MEIDCQNKFVAQSTKLSSNLKKLLVSLKRSFLPLVNLDFKQTISAEKALAVAEPFKISHFVMLSQSDCGVYMRVIDYKQRKSTTYSIISYAPMNSFKSVRENIFDRPAYIAMDGFKNHHLTTDVDRVLCMTQKNEIFHLRHYHVLREDKVRLVEIGPRIDMEVYKIEDDLLNGKVLFNKYVSKSEEEIAANRNRIVEREKLKKQRREEQERNVERKKRENCEEDKPMGNHQREAKRGYGRGDKGDKPMGNHQGKIRVYGRGDNGDKPMGNGGDEGDYQREAKRGYGRGDNKPIRNGRKDR